MLFHDTPFIFGAFGGLLVRKPLVFTFLYAIAIWIAIIFFEPYLYDGLFFFGCRILTCFLSELIFYWFSWTTRHKPFLVSPYWSMVTKTIVILIFATIILIVHEAIPIYVVSNFIITYILIAILIAVMWFLFWSETNHSCDNICDNQILFKGPQFLNNFMILFSIFIGVGLLTYQLCVWVFHIFWFVVVEAITILVTFIAVLIYYLFLKFFSKQPQYIK